ncbi:phage transcriptional regulator, AlpA [Solidesulfovibrio carbinoliphilus subsp. oakridgensis]|uniref:Phage transcriptional regulator, AlpA n=1 Tax=Solidesulfovibrio carbinoliphilus subsp. oakridgensis TaxID=694327 RepID=G7Q5Z0_9BACT|nr:phage transcriptional regulator, AlpA [Solidesulfovibrio carbinoliphilus subsp. oakridgensis]
MGGHSQKENGQLQNDLHKPERLLRLPAVLDRIGYKRSRFLDLVRQGVFPKPVKLGGRAVAWPESVVDDLVDRLVAGKGATHE